MITVKANKREKVLSIFFLIGAGLFLLSLPLILWGCATTGSETSDVNRPGASDWRDGQVAWDVEAALPKLVQAVIRALQALELNVTKTDIKKDKGLVIGEYVDNKTIWIDLRSTSEFSTHLEIRVSIQGNREASLRILEKIQEYL